MLVKYDKMTTLSAFIVALWNVIWGLSNHFQSVNCTLINTLPDILNLSIINRPLNSEHILNGSNVFSGCRIITFKSEM